MLITNFSGIKELVLLGNSLFIFTMSKISKSLIFYFTHKKKFREVGRCCTKRRDAPTQVFSEILCAAAVIAESSTAEMQQSLDQPKHIVVKMQDGYVRT